MVKFSRKYGAGPCRVPSIAGDKVFVPGDTIEVPENLAIYFRSTQIHDTGWEELVLQAEPEKEG
jgi:hypothetical protein